MLKYNNGEKMYSISAMSKIENKKVRNKELIMKKR